MKTLSGDSLPTLSIPPDPLAPSAPLLPRPRPARAKVNKVRRVPKPQAPAPAPPPPAPQTPASQLFRPPKPRPEPREAPFSRSRRLSKAQLAREADKQLRENARIMLKKWFVSVNAKIDDGDGRTIEMVGRMFQFDKGPGGVTIFNQHLQLNGATSDQSARVRSFDQIIGKLEDTDSVSRTRLLSEAMENSEPDDDDDDEDADIEDADIEDSAIENVSYET